MGDSNQIIFVEERHGIARTNQPIRIGFPLPRGSLFTASRITLINSSGQRVPCQSKPLAFWPDNSIQWILLDFFVSLSPNQREQFTVCHGLDLEAWKALFDSSIPQINECAEDFSINTGSAEFIIPKQVLLPFKSVRIDGTLLVSNNGSQIHLHDQKGDECHPIIDRFEIEEAGPLRVSLLAQGKFELPKRQSDLIFKARIVLYSGKSILQVELLIGNPKAAVHPGGLWDLGDPGSVFFKDLSLKLSLNEEVIQIRWYEANPKETQVSTSKNWMLYQDSSGGQNWRSNNHVDQFGEMSVSFRGYRLFEGLDASQFSLPTKGTRATPAVTAISANGWISATIKDFWQNFPKALRVENGTINLGIFPRESKKFFEIQGGEQKRHVLFLELGLPGQASSISMFQHPPHVWIHPEWVEKTKAVFCFTSQQNDPNDTYLNYIKNIIEGPNSFFSKREIIDEYGWRNFGDLYADHEAVNHSSPNALISHYNNQYDFIYGAFVHFLRSGDRRWQQLMDEAARHMIDIDIYHTDQDKPTYNKGLFWHTDHYRDACTSTHRTYSQKNAEGGKYGGGPSNEHNYTSGLLHYFYLTGDPEAAETVLGLADWVIAMDDGAYGILGLIDESPTGDASQTTSTDYHKPGRGAGNSVNALIDAYRLSGNRDYFNKAEELIQRCIHPRDDIPALNLNEPEYRWSYLVFLQVLGKYLDTKSELGELDFCFYYARDSFLHYADWMVDYEVPYKDVLYKVKIPTETWPAHDIRKSHVFYLAAKYGEPDKHKTYSEKALFFYERCVDDVTSFNTALLTRPLVILCVYGYIHAFFQKVSIAQRIFTRHGYNFGHPRTFLPKKARLASTIRKKIHFAIIDIKRLCRMKWHEYIQYFKTRN